MLHHLKPEFADVDLTLLWRWRAGEMRAVENAIRLPHAHVASAARLRKTVMFGVEQLHNCLKAHRCFKDKRVFTPLKIKLLHKLVDCDEFTNSPTVHINRVLNVFLLSVLVAVATSENFHNFAERSHAKKQQSLICFIK